jgi:hypothetical protein
MTAPKYKVYALGQKAFVSATPFERSSYRNERLSLRQTTQSLMRIPQRKKGFSALCIFDIGGDEKIRTSDPGFAQMLP